MCLKKFGVRRLIEKSYLCCGIYFFSVHLGIAFCRQLKGEKIYQQVTFSNLVGCSAALQRNKDSLIPGIQQV